MKTLLSTLALSLGLAAATTSAQVTYDNNFVAAGSLGIQSFGFTAGQTFTGFESVQSTIWSIRNTSASVSSLNVAGYIAQWDTVNNRVESGTLTSVGSYTDGTVAGSVTGYQVNFTFAPITLNPSLTYVALLSYAGGASSFEAEFTNSFANDFFTSGAAVFIPGTSSVIPSFASTLSSGSFTPISAFDFSMVVTATPGVTPIPEPKTAAAAFAGLFAASLFLRRNGWQKRRIALFANTTA